MKRDINVKLISSIVITCLLGFITAVIFVSAARYSGRADDKQADRISEIIRKAAVQCYALEGRYPPSLEYLAEKYELILDDRRFVYMYENSGIGNMIPSIIVRPKLMD